MAKAKAPVLRSLSALLNEYDACDEAREWANQFQSAAKAWAACQRPDWMLWALAVTKKVDDRKHRLFACACVRGTPLPDGRMVWDLLTDQRSKTAVEVAERFAEGNATQEELAAAMDAAWYAAWYAAMAAARDAAWAWQANKLREIYGNPFAAKAKEAKWATTIPKARSCTRG